MKTILVFLVSMMVVATTLAEPVFTGFMTTREHGTIFVVVPTSQALPRWVKIGDNVEGYHVISFERKDEILVLRKDDENLRLRLKGSKIRDGGTIAQNRLLEEARMCMVMVDKWKPDSGEVCQVALTESGYWNAYLTMIVNGKRAVRLIVARPDGMVISYTKASED